MRRTPDFDEFEFEDLFARMTRQFEEMSRGIDSSRVFGREMAVDLREAPDSFVVAVDLPGFEKADIDLAVADRVLTIEALREESAATDDHDEASHYVRRERHADSVRRSIRLPAAVRADDASASYNNGVLTVTLPKLAVESDDAQQIDVE